MGAGRGALAEAEPSYRRIRDLGQAVWLPRHQVWGVGRFEDVLAALRADKILLSGRGVAANDLVKRG